MVYHHVDFTNKFRRLDTQQIASQAFGPLKIFNSDRDRQFTGADLFSEIRNLRIPSAWLEGIAASITPKCSEGSKHSSRMIEKSRDTQVSRKNATIFWESAIIENINA